MVLIVTDPVFLKHDTGRRHPECKERSLCIDAALKKKGLLTQSNILPPRKATKEEILLCHTESYFSSLQEEITSLEPGDIAPLSSGDVEICKDSFDTALYAAGALLTSVDEVITGPAKTVFCNIRPPGHHATRSQGMGFCLFNNVAIGARYAQRKYGIQRVLICDWDLHHGNGTEEIFENDTSVFYFSTYQNGIYPFPEEKKNGARGGHPVAKGKGSREHILHLFQESLPHAMQTFQPELVLISCGFDAHKNDPLGDLELESEDFGVLTRIIKEIADTYAKGRIISALEGGYNLEALGNSASHHVLALH